MSISAKVKSRNLLRVLDFLAKYPCQTAVVVGMLLFIIGLEMTLPQVIRRTITALRAHLEHGSPFQPWAYAGIFLAIVVIRNMSSFVLGRLRARLIHQVLSDIRGTIYNTLQRLAFRYHDKSSAGELISRSTTDIRQLQEFLVACLLLSLDIAVSLIATIVLIFLINVQIGWTMLLITVPTIALIAFYSKKLNPAWRKIHDQHAAMTTVIQENIAGVRVVKAFAGEQNEIRKFQEKKNIYVRTLLDTMNYWVARVPFFQFIFGLGMPLVLWIGGRQIIADRILIGDLAAVIFYLLAIGHRMTTVGRFTNIMQNASASASRVLEILNEPQEICSGKIILPAGQGAVQFDEVAFYNETGKAVLSNITFEARPGETIAIVGPTGSGKTTLVNLIPRFYEAAKGRILVEGIDIRELDLSKLRRAIGMIFQETFLFSASVAENIAYGCPNASRNEIEASARTAQAHEFIEKLENGYDTVIGERGVSLSGGQKQRLAIARAFLLNPRILILDDATAGVDSETERMIQEAMRRITVGRTTFVIAHRFSTVQHANQILVLKEGQIMERGTHLELIRTGGFYNEIFAQQIKGSVPTRS